MTEEKSDSPGAVSDQNREEQQSGMRDDQQHPEPRSHDEGRSDSERGESESEGGGSSGAAGEGSQSTGNPDSAG
jgi:hypothetical protein